VDLTDEQWDAIRSCFPSRERKRTTKKGGRPWRDPRDVINGVMWVLRSGAHWHDLPERYGKWKSTHKRFSRWAKNGVWEAVFTRLRKDPQNDYVMIDSTLVKAHQQAATGKRGRVSRRWGDPVED